MENSQVTFAVQASQVTGPPGSPILVISIVLDRNPQQLVLYRKFRTGILEESRIDLNQGPISATTLETIEAITADQLYTALAFFKGIQAEFESRL